MKLTLLGIVITALCAVAFAKKDIIRYRPKCERFSILTCNFKDYCSWNPVLNTCQHKVNSVVSRPLLVRRRRPVYYTRRVATPVLRRGVLRRNRLLFAKKK